jgi:hypothetical protein
MQNCVKQLPASFLDVKKFDSKKIWQQLMQLSK